MDLLKILRKGESQSYNSFESIKEKDWCEGGDLNACTSSGKDIPYRECNGISLLIAENLSADLESFAVGHLATLANKCIK